MYDQVASLALKDRKVAFELVELLQESEAEVGENAAEAIGRIGRDNLEIPETVKLVMPRLKDLLEHPRAQVREVTTQALVNIAWNRLMWEDIGEIMRPLIAWFTKLLYDPDVRVRRNALGGIRVAAEWMEDNGQDADIALLAPTLPQLLAFLTDAEPSSRGDAVWALTPIAHRNPEMVEPMVGEIVRLLKDSNDHVRLGASATLRYVAEAHPETVWPSLSTLLLLLKDPDWRVCQNAAIALGFIAGNTPEVAKVVVPKLTELLGDKRALFRADAASALARLGETNPDMVRPALPQLEALLEDDDERVRQSAVEAVRRIRNANS